MAYSPSTHEPIPPMVSIYVPAIAPWFAEAVAATAPTSTSAESGICYLPVVLRGGCAIRRVWWANGATTTGGATIEVGVYADSGYGPGSKLVSGSAVQGTASNVQFVTVTATFLRPGRYWIAVVASTTNNTTMMRSAPGTRVDAATRLAEAGTSLPSSATAVETANAHIWLCGFATTASP